jgi:hypothetical protein
MSGPNTWSVSSTPKTRLSSEYLFHYKKDLRVLCLILKGGFRHSVWDETLPYRKSKQFNYICSFCDILPCDADYHTSCYGKNALALTKTWGIKNGISPVRYIHESSAGASETYHAHKVLLRNAILSEGRDDTEMFVKYLCSSMVYDENTGLRNELMRQGEPDLLLRLVLGEKFNQFKAMIDSIPAGAPQQTIDTIFTSLFNRIKELHNELERRDAFVRAYVEDFQPSSGPIIVGKVLYDEREWRSVKMTNPIPVETGVSRNRAAHDAGFLPPEYNLSFSADDVKYVIVENVADKQVVLDFVVKEKCLISPDELSARLITFEELPAHTS